MTNEGSKLDLLTDQVGRLTEGLTEIKGLVERVAETTERQAAVAERQAASIDRFSANVETLIRRQ